MNWQEIKIAFVFSLTTAAALAMNANAQGQGRRADESVSTTSVTGASLTGTSVSGLDGDRFPAELTVGKPAETTIEPAIGNENALGTPFLSHLISDQMSIWSSTAHVRWADGTWLFPLAAATAGLFATDRSAAAAISSVPIQVKRYTNASNYGAYAMVAAGGGFYVWGKISRDDHRRETGILAGEAAINAFALDTALKYAFGRERPNQGAGLGNFFQAGVSFPSDHSAVAWSIASVIAHEYPGPFTQVAVYGLAAAVSASRVLGKQHFPSDVVVGAALGLVRWP